jgi:ribosome biogenesis SPOUT family RNA methylase Rps3
MKYIIEHLEPEMFDWCVIEYRHISQIVGKENLIITNVKKGNEKIEELGEIHKESVSGMKLQKACVLDPEAMLALHPEDSEEFEYLIFGGILGDHPPRKRTKPELTSKIDADSRNLGDRQMSTDTAVYVAKKIVDGIPLRKIKFKDGIELDVAEGESVILPYRYVLENGKIVLPEGFVEFLRDRDEF